MTKAVTKKKEAAVAVYDETELAGWGDNEFSQSDIIIPKVVLMQNNSQLVADVSDLNSGDYIHSVTKAVVGNDKNPIEFIPFMMKKLYRVTVKGEDDFEYSHMEPWDQRNDLAPKEYLYNEKEAQRQKVYQFYAFVGDETIPMIITMKGMSFGAGKQLANEMFLVNKIKQLPPPGRTFKLGVENVDYKNKKYKGYKIEEIGETPLELVKGKVFDWYKTISAGAVNEHDESEVENESSDVKEHYNAESVEVNGQF